MNPIKSRAAEAEAPVPLWPARPPEAPPPLYIDHLKTINATFYDQLKVVDQKAAYIFTFVIALLAWSASVRQVFTQVAEPAADLRWLLACVMAGSISLAMVSAVAVVVPRQRAGGTPLYWGAWPQAAERLDSIEPGEAAFAIAEDYRANGANLAAICRIKFRWARRAWLSLFSALACYVVLLASAG